MSATTDLTTVKTTIGTVLGQLRTAYSNAAGSTGNQKRAVPAILRIEDEAQRLMQMVSQAITTVTPD